MRNRLAFAFGWVVVGCAGAQLGACSSSSPAAAPTDAGGTPDVKVLPQPDSGGFVVPDAAVANCTLLNSGTASDPVSLCLQKAILQAEHGVFSATTGTPTSWDLNTGLVNTDGGVPLHDVTDDLAYGASLGLYAISSGEYGDTEFQAAATADMVALAALLQKETLPAGYDGRVYMRLRRLAQGLRVLNQGAAADSIDALAETYGKAIYSTYFHPLTAVIPDAGSGEAGAGDDGGSDDGGGVDASAHDAGAEDAGDAEAGAALLGDGMLGVAGANGIAYDVDQAASGALALVDLAWRHEGADAANAHLYARAAGSVFAHLQARARDAKGLYYSDLVTSGDPGHDALATAASDALFADVQASVAISLVRARDTIAAKGLTELAGYPFDDQAKSLMTALQTGTEALWDLSSNSATASACSAVSGTLPSCGSGFFATYAPSNGGLDKTRKTLRSNALLFAAIQRTLVAPNPPTSLDIAPLRAVLIQRLGESVSFLTQTFNQSSYPPVVAVTAPGAFSIAPEAPSATAKANADAIESLSDGWIGARNPPPTIF